MVEKSSELVITTGRESWIKNIWYPSLRDSLHGNYQGDILIVDYPDGFSTKFVEELQLYPNVLYRKVQKHYESFASDRIYQFYTILKNELREYHTILITDGSDIEFLKPIQPLLDMASKEFCYSKEEESNMAIRCFGCLPKFPKEQWEYIKDKPIVNAGMLAGPRREMLNLMETMIENMDRYGAEFGSEQLTLNILIYYYMVKAKDVGATWNYTMVSNRRCKFRFEYGRCFGEEFGRRIEISILHSNGRALGRYLGKMNGKVRKRYINGQFINPMTFTSDKPLFPYHPQAVKKGDNFLFSKH